MRLGGFGSSATEGYVEAFDITTGQWGGICDHSFDVYDAHVICKMLGFTTAVEALIDKMPDLYGFSPSGSNFTLDDLDCNGSESSVFDCIVTGEPNEICEASDIAGVKCGSSKIWPSIWITLLPLD